MSCADNIQAAHIVPAKSVVKGLTYIMMSVTDCFLLSRSILRLITSRELLLSYVKSYPLSQLYVKLWENTCCNTEVFSGAGKTIGQLDCTRLDLGNHLIVQAV